MKKKKRVAAVALIALIVMLTIPAFGSYNAVGPTASGTTHTVRKADSRDVVKDGVIGENEYDRLSVELEADVCPLHLVFHRGEDLYLAERMLPTMEYYASWSDGQINIAVKSSPPDLKQVIKKDESVNPDDFCKNVALTVSSDHVQARPKGTVCNFYFAVSLTTDTGEYQVAWYDTDQNQQGNSGTYVPAPGKDFVISYVGDSVIFEWSVPFSEITETGTAAAGDSVYLTIACTSGESETAEDESIYGVVMGDFGYGVSQRDAVNHAAFLLSGETVKDNTAVEDTGPIQSAEIGKTSVPTETNERGEPVPVPAETDKEGNPVPASPEGGSGSSSGGKAPQTGDPMIVIAAIAALSACGAVVVKKKFF